MGRLLEKHGVEDREKRPQKRQKDTVRKSFTSPATRAITREMKTPAINNDRARSAFLGKIDNARLILEAISAHLDDHFGVAPEEVNWAHAGDVGRMVNNLEEIAATFNLVVK